MANAVVKLVNHDVRVDGAVEILCAVAIDVLRPTATSVPEEHLHRGVVAIIHGGREDRVVPSGRSGRTGVGVEPVAPQSAAAEVVLLEIRGGFVEPKIVEEVVDEIGQEKELSFGEVSGVEGEIEVPHAAHQSAHGTRVACGRAIRRAIVAFQEPGIEEDRGWVAKLAVEGRGC